MKARLFIAAVIAATTFGGAAAAQEQPWLADRRMGEGIGIRTGNLELHPGASLEAGYDSNYFLRSENEDPVDVFRLRGTLSLSLSTLGERRRVPAAGAPPALTFRAATWLAYNEIVALDSQYSEQVSDHRHVDAGVGGHADIGPGRTLGGDVYADFIRTGEPSNDFSPDVAFDRGSARGGAGVIYRPGGGMFDWRLGYEIRYHYFEDDAFGGFDNFNHSVLTRGRWRFIPRTALLYDAQYTLVRYTNDTSQNDGDFVQARMGLNGLVTTRLSFLALLGWNSSYYEDRGVYAAQNYDGYVAHGELKWFLLPAPTGDSASVGLSSVAAGYTRSFSNSYLGSFYVRDRGYANFNYFMGGVFLLSAEAGFSHNSYPASVYVFTPPGGTPTEGVNAPFTENRIDARLFGEYRFSDRFAVNSTFLYEQRLSDFSPAVPCNEPDGLCEEDLDARRWQAWLGLRWFM